MIILEGRIIWILETNLDSGNWKGVPACVVVEGGLLCSDLDGFSDTVLVSAAVSIEVASLLKAHLMVWCIDVDVLSDL